MRCKTQRAETVCWNVLNSLRRPEYCCENEIITSLDDNTCVGIVTKIW